MPEYERLEEEALPAETHVGGINHNGSTVLESRTPLFGRQTRHPEAIEPDATMANDLRDQNAESQAAEASTDGVELDLAFGVPFKEKPLWVDLYESIRDIFFPPKLPPLELTSTPIPAPDRMIEDKSLLADLYESIRDIFFPSNLPPLELTSTPIQVPDPIIKDKPIWVSLYESIRDIFFPPKLPPLELTSTPIPVPDRMAFKRNPWAFGISTSVNVGLAALALLIGVKTYINNMQPKMQVTKVDITEWNAPKNRITAGGGGGSPDHMEAIKGKIPPRAKVPDPTPKVETPPDPMIDVQKDIIIPDNLLPNFGMSKSSNIKLVSSGNGSGMGMGNGKGSGYGDGTGWNTGGGIARVGGGISAPIPLNSVEAEFSDEARRAKYQGVVLVSLIVDAQGYPQNPRVIRALGMGLDEKALEAVRKYRFKPAMKDGKTPVAVYLNVEVNFHLY